MTNAVSYRVLLFYGISVFFVVAIVPWDTASVGIFYLFPSEVFGWLINASGVIALFVYLLISVSQLVPRRRPERENPEAPQIKMWSYPWLTYLSILGILAVLLAVFSISDLRVQAMASFISLGVILLAYLARRAFGPPEKDPSTVIQGKETE